MVGVFRSTVADFSAIVAADPMTRGLPLAHDALTLSERRALELFADGPITPQMEADVIARRARIPGPAQLRRRLAAAQDELAFWQESLRADPDNEWTGPFTRHKIRETQAEIDRLDDALMRARQAAE